MLWLHTPERFRTHAGEAVELMFYDAPVSYLLRDEAGTAYLSVFAAVEEHADGETVTWLSVPISEEDARRLRTDFDTSYAAVCQRSAGPFLTHTLRWYDRRLPRPEHETTCVERELTREQVPVDMWPTDTQEGEGEGSP